MSYEAEFMQQIEETEALLSIYDGDENFKQLNDTTFQYKYTDGNKSFILEVSWGPAYPTVKPTINVDLFYNQDLLPSIKQKIIAMVDAEAEIWLGCAMTFSLFECLRDKVEEILAEQPEEPIPSTKVAKISIMDQPECSKKEQKEKKEHKTKAQKRRAWDKVEGGRGGERPRGSDWVDIIKHLSQAPHPPAT